MLWFTLAFLTASFTALKDIFSKIGLRNIDEYLVTLSICSFTMIFLSPLLFITHLPVIKPHFWSALFLAGIINLFALVFYMKALKYGDLSLATPMITFTPLFLLVTSPFMIGEFPKTMGIIGTVLIVFGSYILNIAETHKGFWAPFKAIFTQKGPRYMLCVALIYSVSANFDKIGVKNSSPIFWGATLNGFIMLVMIPVVITRKHSKKKKMNLDIKKLLPIGLSNSLAQICQLTAIKLTLLVNVISIKRLSVLMCVLVGHLLFKEAGLKERAAGAIIMIIGVLFITLS